MKYNKKLEKYIPLVDFISAACGDNFEVILHDTQNPTSSMLSVPPGHFSKKWTFKRQKNRGFNDRPGPSNNA